MKNLKINSLDNVSIALRTNDTTFLSAGNNTVIVNDGLTNDLYISGTNERLTDNGDNNNIVLNGIMCVAIVNGEDVKIYSIGYDNTIIVNGNGCKVYISKEASASVSAVIGTSIIFDNKKTIIDGVEYMPNQFYSFE